ncbi:MAG TPA: MoxR family ATPase [Rubricoccaceae bacterium]|jgi:MoxR-like ATPase
MSEIVPPVPSAAATPPDLGALTDRVAQSGAFVGPLLAAVGRVVVGQPRMVERLLIGLLTGGHVLLEGVPGLAKTLAVSTLARAIDARFQRIQFTPDLLPADLVGTLVYNQGTGAFLVKKGPVFANIVLADEVNRAPAKVQSALLEAMQERQVTIGDTTYPLPQPFLVLATQNPVEQEGTYPLPEAQVDRFMLKTVVTYPTRDEELAIMRRMAQTAAAPEVAPVVTLDAILAARQTVGQVYVDARVEEYVVDLVLATREPERYGLADLRGLVAYGASPRASIALNLAARAHAFLRGRAYTTPDDVRSVALDVLRHRVAVTYEAEAEEVTAEQIVGRVLDAVEVP